MFKLGVSGVVRNARGEVLLVRTDAAGWELPGGGVEAGEDVRTALRREALEESGCELQSIGDLSGVYHVVESGLVLLIFHATSNCIDPAPPEADADVRAAGWFSPIEALARVTHEREHQRLADALANAAAAIVRSD